MRTITITLPDAIAEELEADAQNSGQNLADFAGEKFAFAYNVAASLPKWVNGETVNARLETRQEKPKENDPLLTLLQQWIAEGENATPEGQIAADAELAELKTAMNAEREKAGMRALFP